MKRNKPVRDIIKKRELTHFTQSGHIYVISTVLCLYESFDFLKARYIKIAVPLPIAQCLFYFSGITA